MSRSDNSIKNIFVSVIMTVVNVLFGFFVQKIFILYLGKICLGVNGLFSNIISMLSIADLGIGTAIVYNLYKPIYHNNKEKIKTLLLFYKKCYRIIALVVLVIGFSLIPFLPGIVGGENLIEINNLGINIHLIFILFLIDSVFSYLLTYKRSILYADQKNYIINITHTIMIMLMYIFQIIVLIIFKNYYLFLLIKIICRVIENIIINSRVNKIYPFLKGKKCKKLDKYTKNDISKRVKASLFHNVGGYIVLGTDNILISSIFGIELVGRYSNYLLIISTLNNIIGQAFTSITSSIGNLLNENNKTKTFKIEENIREINLYIYIVCSCMLYCCLKPFITIWLGRDFLLSNIVTIALVINFYFQGMRKTMQLFAEAGGVCYENRFVPLMEAVVNIISSILFAKLIGLSGIFIGTILSSFVLHFYSYPKYVYKGILYRKPFEYITDFIKKTFIMLIILLFNIIIVNHVTFNNILLQLIFNFLFSLCTSLVYIIVIYRNSSGFEYLIMIIKKILVKINFIKESNY